MVCYVNWQHHVNEAVSGAKFEVEFLLIDTKDSRFISISEM